MPEITDREYPFLLLTGRGTVAQWHTQTRTGKVEKLRRIYPQEVYVEINPEDARELGIEQGAWVQVGSRRAEVRARAAVKDTVPRGQVFMPMHYVETNRLTFPAFDPYSREPAYKMGAVAVRRSS
jgi:assimilatory nitrate reductase catalytic subunit